MTFRSFLPLLVAAIALLFAVPALADAPKKKANPDCTCVACGCASCQCDGKACQCPGCAGVGVMTLNRLGRGTIRCADGSMFLLTRRQARDAVLVETLCKYAKTRGTACPGCAPKK